eukprot:GFUD01029856.1.p1 GENE.GFUD01029856.1~~GFUD01029856.1.p1  ORF type:complete len:237 (-),score=102.02 GFUD01029856.1:177-887(-)
MASFVIGEDTVRMEKQRKEMENIAKSRRHYKKDSRYLEDLYTLTYQEDFSIEDTEEEKKEKTNGLNLGLASLQVHRDHTPGHSSSPLTRSLSSGPMSLSQLDRPQMEKQFASSTLDTNLHKILARRMAGGQGVSFRSCKLLTKAYYKLLRQPVAQTTTSHQQQAIIRLNSKDDPKLNWQTLLQTDGQQLANIVAGYSALVKSLNEELVTELIIKDDITAEQDFMLDTISDLTDSLL